MAVGLILDYPFQRKLFYASGRHWLFYSDGTNFVYKTSVGGVVWSDSTTIRACVASDYISVWLDDTSIHYVCAVASKIFYRKGTLNSDGTISWDAIEQVVRPAVAGIDYAYPSITVDSDGYPWIGYRRHDAGIPEYCPYVIKSSTRDGTWTTPGGWPERLSGINDRDWLVLVLPLTALKIYVIYSRLNQTIKGKLYDGGWGVEETCTTNTMGLGAFSAVSENDDVHLVFRYAEDPVAVLYYVKRDYSSGWGSEVKLKDLGRLNAYFEISIDDDTGYLYVFLLDYINDKIQFIKCSGAWGEWFDFVLDAHFFSGAYTPIVSYKKYGRTIDVAWLSGAAEVVRFAVFTILPTVLKGSVHAL